MFDIFNYIPLRDILIAPDVEMINSIRRAEGLELGIENPIVRFALYQGVPATTAILVGTSLFLVRVTRSLRPGHRWPVAYFVASLMTFESIGTKSTLLAKGAVMMVILLRLDPGVKVWKPRAPSVRSIARDRGNAAGPDVKLHHPIQNCQLTPLTRCSAQTVRCGGDQVSPLKRNGINI